MAEIAFRPVALKDVDLVTEQRVRMFADNDKGPDVLDPMRGPFRDWLTSKLQSGEYSGWIGEADGQAVAGCGMVFIDWPPHYAHPTVDRRAYVLNVYIAPTHRGRGLAKRMMAMCEAESRARGVPYMVLHASPMGRPLYESMNWQATNEMSRTLNLEERP